MENKLTHSFVDKEHLELKLYGDFISYSNDAEKNLFLSALEQKNLKKITIDSSSLGKWDSSLVVILFDALKITNKNKIDFATSSLPEGLQRLLNLAFAVDRKPQQKGKGKESFLVRCGEKTLDKYDSFKEGLVFIGEAFKSIGRFFRGKAVMRPIDFQFALEDSSYKALSIVALICFMVGMIFGFVGAMQLKLFGAQIFVAGLVAIAMVRVMGAVMTGIIISGRTGASYAATIGTMQVNEEIDALKTMGIPPIDFLLLPRMLALIIMMPLLTVFADVLGMLGGAVVGIFLLDLAPLEYWEATLKALNMKNFLVGLFHGFVFGCIISLCGCYCGIKCGRDADSVGKATTNAVVYSIVWLIIATAIITLTCNFLGI